MHDGFRPQLGQGVSTALGEVDPAQLHTREQLGIARRRIHAVKPDHPLDHRVSGDLGGDLGA